MNNNPVFLARYFQYKVEIFFKEIVFDGPLGKAKYYTIHIEFQERGSAHAHSFIFIFDAPIVEYEAAYLEFT